LAQPITWLSLAALLVASPGIAQPQLPASRQRQDRRAALSTAPSEELLKLHVAAGHLTTVIFNGPLDRDSLVADRTRFKWLDVGDRFLLLQPFADLGPGEQLILKIGFKDRALPAQATLAVVTDSQVVDGNVEVDRRANTPEALLAALAQKDARLEELQARCEEGGLASLFLAGWRHAGMKAIEFAVAPTTNASHLMVEDGIGYTGPVGTLLSLNLRNESQEPWTLGQTRLTGPTSASVKVLSARMKPARLAPGERGQVVMELEAAPWAADPSAFVVELVEASGQRRSSFNLRKQ
jgi:uncharacterized protein (TIGR02268 family)